MGSSTSRFPFSCFCFLKRVRPGTAGWGLGGLLYGYPVTNEAHLRGGRPSLSTAPQEAGLHSNKMLKEPAFLWQAPASSSHNSRRAFYGLGRGWGHKAGEGHPHVVPEGGDVSWHCFKKVVLNCLLLFVLFFFFFPFSKEKAAKTFIRVPKSITVVGEILLQVKHTDTHHTDTYKPYPHATQHRCIHHTCIRHTFYSHTHSSSPLRSACPNLLYR